ncbi:MAG: nitroreductase family deazaflavin-dependent oxidoreductase [Anaerolineae bacterium]
MTSFNDFNKTVIAEFRANGGQVGGQFANASLLLLSTIGAKSDQTRTNPLAYTHDGDRIIVIASKGGAPTHPDWYYNVKANPTVTVELGREQFQARAVVAEGTERDRLFTHMAAAMPGFADYQRNTERQIPVVILERMS